LKFHDISLANDGRFDMTDILPLVAELVHNCEKARFPGHLTKRDGLWKDLSSVVNIVNPSDSSPIGITLGHFVG
jgi:hypothetical protein